MLPIANYSLRTRPEPMTSPFQLIPGDPSSSVVIHVPHASTYIPAAVRKGISLADAELVAEAERMADVATDHLAIEAAGRVSEKPWLLVEEPSSKVCTGAGTGYHEHRYQHQ